METLSGMKEDPRLKQGYFGGMDQGRKRATAGGNLMEKMGRDLFRQMLINQCGEVIRGRERSSLHSVD
jgi:hypothetical protein